MTLLAAPQIADLEDLLARLPADVRATAARLYQVTSTVGRLDAPAEMEPWIVKLFGSVEAVKEQRIVRVTDLVTLQGALFNELRARRPMEVKGADEMRRTIDEGVGDPFCKPLVGTPADTFGRIRGERAMTAANIAKYDGYHGVLVFDGHDPLAPIDADQMRGLLATARRWASAALEADPGARYYFLMWNATWRAGGSVIHGHMQMTTTRGMHYPKVESLRRQALEYGASGRDYFDDLWAVHQALGLGVEAGRARVLASLTPVKERECIVLGRPGDGESALAEGIVRVIGALRSQGVVAHNMALYLPPLAPDGEDRPTDGEDWSGFAPHARLVDRGDPANRTSDIGAMELYAASVIASDPFRVADGLRG